MALTTCDGARLALQSMPVIAEADESKESKLESKEESKDESKAEAAQPASGDADTGAGAGADASSAAGTSDAKAEEAPAVTAPDLDPIDEANRLREVGNNYWRANNAAAAEQAYLRGISYDPRNVKLFNNLAAAQLQLGKFEVCAAAGSSVPGEHVLTTGRASRDVRMLCRPREWHWNCVSTPTRRRSSGERKHRWHWVRLRRPSTMWSECAADLRRAPGSVRLHRSLIRRMCLVCSFVRSLAGLRWCCNQEIPPCRTSS